MTNNLAYATAPSADVDADTDLIPLDVVAPVVTSPDVDNANLNANAVWGAQGWNNPADTATETVLPEWDESGADLNDLPVLDGYGPACPSCRVLTALATWHCDGCDVTVPRTAATRGPVAPPRQGTGPLPRPNAPEILDARGNSGGTRLRCTQADCTARAYNGGWTCKVHNRRRVEYHTYDGSFLAPSAA